jgi:hypothetical protein
VIVISPSQHPGAVGVRMGMSFAVGAVGLLIGEPVPSAVVKSNRVGLQVYSETPLLVAMIVRGVSDAGGRLAIQA